MRGTCGRIAAMGKTGFLFGTVSLMAFAGLSLPLTERQAETNAVADSRAPVALPPYLEEDFDAACQKAKKEGRLVFVSLGREICGRCQKFYGFVRNGQVSIDPKKYVFIRLDVDNYEHREYFYSTFDPPDRKLPFVGVMDGDRAMKKEALSGSRSPAEYQALMDK